MAAAAAAAALGSPRPMDDIYAAKNANAGAAAAAAASREVFDSPDSHLNLRFSVAIWC